jgi:hypothetical protein
VFSKRCCQISPQCNGRVCDLTTRSQVSALQTAPGECSAPEKGGDVGGAVLTIDGDQYYCATTITRLDGWFEAVSPRGNVDEVYLLEADSGATFTACLHLPKLKQVIHNASPTISYDYS